MHYATCRGNIGSRMKIVIRLKTDKNEEVIFVQTASGDQAELSLY